MKALLSLAFPIIIWPTQRCRANRDIAHASAFHLRQSVLSRQTTCCYDIPIDESSTRLAIEGLLPTRFRMFGKWWSDCWLWSSPELDQCWFWFLDVISASIKIGSSICEVCGWWHGVSISAKVDDGLCCFLDSSFCGCEDIDSAANIPVSSPRSPPNSFGSKSENASSISGPAPMAFLSLLIRVCTICKCRKM